MPLGRIRNGRFETRVDQFDEFEFLIVAQQMDAELLEIKTHVDPLSPTVSTNRWSVVNVDIDAIGTVSPLADSAR